LIPTDLRRDITPDIIIKVFPSATEINGGLLPLMSQLILNTSLKGSWGEICKTTNSEIYRQSSSKLCEKFGCKYGFRK
jgi:hypothetical protein